MVTPELDRNRRWSARQRTALALALALAVHGAVAVLLAVAAALWPPPPPQPRAQAVALREVSPQQWALNRRIATAGAELPPADPQQPGEDAPEPPEKKEEIKPEKEKEPQGQVVDVAPGNRQEAKDARYLATTSNTVKRETVARQQSAFYQAAMPHRTRLGEQEDVGSDPVDEVVRNGNGGRGNDDARESAQGSPRGAMELPTVQRREEIRLRDEGGSGPGAAIANRTESEALKGNSDRLLLRAGEAVGGAQASQGTAGAPGLANLIPSPGTLDKIAGDAPPEAIDAARDDSTLVNTKEWRFAGFMNRVTRYVVKQWNPMALLDVRDPTHNIYGTHDWTTLIQVTLDERGELKDVTVEQGCGVDFLDLEAVHSFERIAHFPNPPKGLLEADGKVRFEFVFEVDLISGQSLHFLSRPD